MRLRLWIITFVLLAGVRAQAQPKAAVNVYVKETAGIRRSAYPVNARVPFAKGVLRNVEAVRLMSNEREVAAQFGAESRWPDQTVQWLAVDFNATIAPLEQQTYQLEYGEGVKAGTTPRGLTVTQTSDAIQAGNVRFNKTGSPLVLSVRYRQEDIGSGANGFTLTDAAGGSHDLTDAGAVTVDVVKPGPLYVSVRYSGRVAIDSSYSVPFTITAEMPNSKSWVKYSASVEDSARRVRDISFSSPLALSTAPMLWDFGTGSWTYGSFRNPTDSVVMTQVVKPNGSDWQVKTGAKGQEQPYEVAGGSRPKVAEGWGHFQDSKEVVAFGIDRFGLQAGTYTVAFDALGQSSYRFAPAQPSTRHELTVYQHYVATPTPIGAVTSPVSMLNALNAVCDRDQYVKAGVPVPADARK